MTCREAILEIMRDGTPLSREGIFHLISKDIRIGSRMFDRIISNLENDGLIIKFDSNLVLPFYTYIGTNTF